MEKFKAQIGGSAPTPIASKRELEPFPLTEEDYRSYDLDDIWADLEAGTRANKRLKRARAEGLRDIQAKVVEWEVVDEEDGIWVARRPKIEVIEVEDDDELDDEILKMEGVKEGNSSQLSEEIDTTLTQESRTNVGPPPSPTGTARQSSSLSPTESSISSNAIDDNDAASHTTGNTIASKTVAYTPEYPMSPLGPRVEPPDEDTGVPEILDHAPPPQIARPNVSPPVLESPFARLSESVPRARPAEVI